MKGVQMQESVGIKRIGSRVKEMQSIKNAKRGGFSRLSRAGRGATVGNRENLPSKQSKHIDEFYENARKIAKT